MMISGREAVEWGFGKIGQLFTVLELENMTGIAAIMNNYHTCLYGSQVS